VDLPYEEEMKVYQIENYSLEVESVSAPFKRRTLIYVHNKVTYKRQSELEKIDSHIIVIQLPRQDTFVVSVYRTYQLTTHRDHQGAFREQIGVLDNVLSREKRTLLLGDFNLDHNKRGDPSYHHSGLYELWKEIENRHQLSQLVKFATWSRVCRSTLKTSILDHIYTNDEGLIDYISELSTTIGDHSPIMATLVLKVCAKPKVIWTRNWKNYTKEALLVQLIKENWEITCLNAEDFNDALEQKIMTAFGELVPMEEKIIRSNYYEPIAVSSMKRKRKHLLINAKRRRSCALFERCRVLSKKIRKVEKDSRKKKIRDTILSGGPQGLWQGYRLAENKPRTSLPATLLNDNLEFTNDATKAQAFADFFRKKVETITSQTGIDPNVYNGHQQHRTPDENFFTLSNVFSTMSNLKDKRCYGFDNIPVKVLRDGASVLAPVYLRLFNQIYSQNVVPEKWRTARIIPLHKKGSTSQIENYRPIGNLCSGSKIFERLILLRLQEVEEKRGVDMSGQTQHGFKKNRSTTSAALALQKSIAEAMDEDNYVGVASMDLTAAFDVIDVDLLLTRLELMGLPNDIIRLITAWLKDRIAYVEVGSSCSEYYIVDFGSGQGSILGPVLFNYYVAPLVIEDDILTYADDNYLVASGKQKVEMLADLQRQIIKAEQWMSGSGLKVNLEKTELVVFHRYDTSRSEIRVRDKNITSKQSMKVLGVHFDSRLTWDIHVDKAILKSRGSLHALRTLRSYFTVNEMIKLITSNVYSKLYYASLVWLLPNLKEKLFKKLFSHSGKVLSIVDKNCSYLELHKKHNRSTPKIFALYQTSLNLYHTFKKTPDELNAVTLNDRRNARLTFVRNNKCKVGLNMIKNRMRSISNVIDKDWLVLSEDSFKLSCKKRIIQNSLMSM
jgi:hypothetical protein